MRVKHLLLLALALPVSLLAGSADPGAPFVAVEKEVAQAIARDGSWTAFRAYALPQTEIFVPQRVKALEFGEKIADLRNPAHRQTEDVWVSCDGTVGVTTGRWRYAGTPTAGWYEAIWGKLKDGSYRLLLTHAGRHARKLHTRPGRKGMRAACSGKPFMAVQAPAEGDDFKFGASNDMTLNWTSLVSRQGKVQIIIRIWDGVDFVPVLEDVAPAPVPR